MNETLVRSLSGTVYVFLLIFSTLHSREAFLLLFVFFLIQTVREFLDLIQLSKLPAIVVAICLFVVFGYFSNNQSTSDLGLLLMSIFVCLQLIFWLFSGNSKCLVFLLDKWVKLIGYIVLPFVFLTKIVTVQKGTESVYYPYFLIGIFIIIWTNDSFAYLVGKSLGKNKLFEKISPKKTIEGFIGGLLFALLSGIFISMFLEKTLSVYHWMIISLIVSVFGTIGDLIQSKFKRIAGVKDSGNIMPGHGGIYDRLDSVIFVIPFVYLFFKILEYVS